jgi:hypothetical protein
MVAKPAVQLLEILLEGEEITVSGSTYVLDAEFDLCLVGRHAENGERILMPTNLKLKDFIRIGQKFEIVKSDRMH